MPFSLNKIPSRNWEDEVEVKAIHPWAADKEIQLEGKKKKDVERSLLDRNFTYILSFHP